MLITAKEARMFGTAPEPKTHAFYVMEAIKQSLEEGNEMAKVYFSKQHMTVIGRGMSRSIITIDTSAWKEWIEGLGYKTKYTEQEDPTTGSSFDKRWEFTITWTEKEEG